jgi:hypothetical protein
MTWLAKFKATAEDKAKEASAEGVNAPQGEPEVDPEETAEGAEVSAQDGETVTK